MVWPATTRALEIVSNRLNEALRVRDLEEARKQLGFLQSWGPSELSTLEAALRVAEAFDDRAAILLTALMFISLPLLFAYVPDKTAP